MDDGPLGVREEVGEQFKIIGRTDDFATAMPATLGLAATWNPELAVAYGDGWKVPPRPASFFAVNAADADWVDRQCTMHPLSSFAAPARISGACDDIATIGYILARGFDSPFEQFYAKAGERRWWQAELACGHDVMLDRPNELTALLLQRT